ncbi:oxidoreductase [Nocardioides sp. AE5]|uniref:oxidoreductase n=1 Tax=Nocardioides sp. AE5 TaxID=2962573 RepID=UPI002881A1B4|nr:oxidoreductase [Nocardioides sp. AE5]MDT0200550.1 oxidoreductase [Nocardioides sp. AE5]
MSTVPGADPLASLTVLEGIPSGFAATRDGVDAMLRDRGLRKTAPGLTTESLLRGAVASALLEGSTSTPEEIRAGASDETGQAAIRVSTEALSLVPTLRTAPLQAFARLHALAGKGAVDEERLGRPRDAEAAQGLRELSATLLAPTTAPAMLVAAIVHAQLATAAPFASHNGIVARAAERLVLVARGVDEKSLLVPEAAHLHLRAEYESNLRAYANAGGSNGVHAWLLYATEAYALAAEKSPVRD